jgi:hypothetical protein
MDFLCLEMGTYALGNENDPSAGHGPADEHSSCFCSAKLAPAQGKWSTIPIIPELNKVLP